MADDVENDDQWLYGDAPELPIAESEKPAEEPPTLTEEEPQTQALVPEDNVEKEKEPETQDQEQPAPEPSSEPPPQAEEEEEEGQLPPPGIEDTGPPGLEEGEHTEQDQQNGDGSDKEDSDDDSDDDVNVVIGDIKTSPAYTSLNIKRGGLLTSTVADKSKQQQQTGKFTVEEFDQMGMINGVSASEYNLDSLEDKPWRKPGADITDYFNYGFNEDTWKAYCERQKRLRVNESGVGLVPLNSIGLPRGPVPIMNDNSKYSGSFTGIRKAGPPPGRRMTGAIDVIGGAAALGSKIDAPKENVIQVMTADRREYSRKPPGFPDLSMPPPTTFDEFQPEFGFNPEPEPFYGGYEPTQDLQWGPGGSRNWAPNQIKSLTPGPGMVPAPVPPVTLGPPMVPPAANSPPHSRRGSRDRERESRSRSEKPRDRDRERSHRRDRSRSRSRRHKSRSRSPSHRHRKKKSRRHEDSD